MLQLQTSNTQSFKFLLVFNASVNPLPSFYTCTCCFVVDFALSTTREFLHPFFTFTFHPTSSCAAGLWFTRSCRAGGSLHSGRRAFWCLFIQARLALLHMNTPLKRGFLFILFSRLHLPVTSHHKLQNPPFNMKKVSVQSAYT